MRNWWEWRMPVRTRESEMGFGGRGTRRASELIRPSRRTRARGWMGQGHLSRGGTRWREREGKKGEWHERTRRSNKGWRDSFKEWAWKVRFENVDRPRYPPDYSFGYYFVQSSRFNRSGLRNGRINTCSSSIGKIEIFAAMIFLKFVQRTFARLRRTECLLKN